MTSIGLSDKLAQSLSIVCMSDFADFGPELIDHPRVKGRICVPWLSPGSTGAVTPFTSAYGLFDKLRPVKHSKHAEFYYLLVSIREIDRVYILFT